MNFPAVLLAFLVWDVSSTELSEKYLQDTIENLKLKTSGRNSLANMGNSQPSLNTLSLRRVYNPHSEMASFAQSHDSLSAEVDKIIDNVAGMFSAASLDKEAQPAPPPPPSNPSPAYYPSSQDYQNPQGNREVQGSQGPVPPLHLTKAQLAKMYANAVHKGDTIKLDAGDSNDNEPLTAAVHEVDEDGHLGRPNLNAAKQPGNGYYYYYYPLKSFMDELASSPSGLTFSHNSSEESGSNSKSTRKTGQLQNGPSQKTPYYHPPPSPYHHHHDPYYHSHTHQHNIHVYKEPNMMMPEEKKKGLEPLFMAISGFVGMTVMFILSALFLPKFHKLKPKGLRKDDADEEDYGLGRVALEAIDGYDCGERLACEAGKTAHAFGLLNNRFVKLLRRIGPYSLAKQFSLIGKYTNKKYRCGVIRCRERGAPTKPPLVGQT